MIPSPRVTFHVVEQLSITERGEGGFGSTGAA
jgi:dUTPase